MSGSSKSSLHIAGDTQRGKWPKPSKNVRAIGLSVIYRACSCVDVDTSHCEWVCVCVQRNRISDLFFMWFDIAVLL